MPYSPDGSQYGSANQYGGPTNQYGPANQGYNSQYSNAPNYRSAANDNGSTVHCGVDSDHPPHWYHSRMHHEHYCPGGPHRHY